MFLHIKNSNSEYPLINMKFISILTLLQLALAIRVNPLPAPRSIAWGNTGEIVLDLNALRLESNQKNTIVTRAFERAVTSIVQLRWYPAAFEAPIINYPAFPSYVPKPKRGYNCTIPSVDVQINDYTASLQLGVDESYSLHISEQGSITIESATIWGTLHAFTTLQQLIIYDNGQFKVESSVSINDSPLYPHRGLMIDSGRNFLTIDSILKQVDLLALTKMNTLHWHLQDSQSWPIILKSYPEMARDAYSERESYTLQDLAYVIEYATERGVRIIPEIDMPGHARAGWEQISPELLACANSWWSNDVWAAHTAVEPPAGQLEILNDDIYDVIKNIYDELSSVFPENIFHVGADELQAQCYNYSTITQDWFAANSLRTYKDLSQYYLDHALPIFNNHTNRRLMMWEDILLTPEGAHSVPKDIIMQSWNNDLVNIQNLTAQGYDVVVSSSSHFYLDCGYGGWVTNDPRYTDVFANEVFNSNAGNGGSWCAPYKTWQRIYDYDFTANLTASEKAHVLGAELALWSEQVDSVVLTSKIWPRAAALAELTWSGNLDANGMLRTNSLTQRILNFREWVVAMGYEASPLVPKFCLKNPHACDLYQNQTIMLDY